jgi:TolB protein
MMILVGAVRSLFARALPRLAFAALAAAPLASAASAQAPAATVVVIPPFAFQESRETKAGHSGTIAHQSSELVAADLRTSSDLVVLGPERQTRYVFAEVTAPRFSHWRSTGAKALITGFVNARDDGRLTVGCYVYDVAAGREIGRQGFVVAPEEWRRAAHRCANTAYSKLTGRRGSFDTRIAYVAQSGAAISPVKRIAIMDSDGSNHRYLTQGDTTVLSPRLSPDSERIAFVSFTGGQPHVRVLDLDGGEHRPLVAQTAMSFAPRFSPDGQRIVFTMAPGGNSDIYVVSARGGAPQRLTMSPGVDTSPSFSPDGTKIVFESDRSGSQQIYVMNADGSSQRRISFGSARYASPAWSPDGDLIGFTRVAGDGMRIGVMTSTGADEKILTSGRQDESPSWAPNGRQLLFQRWNPAEGRGGLFVVSVAGGDARVAATPQGGSDPDWSAGAAQ